MIHSLRAGPASNRFQILIFNEELGDDMAFVRKDCCEFCETADCKKMIARCNPLGMTYKSSSCEPCKPCVDFTRPDFVRGDTTLGQPPVLRVDTLRQSRRARAMERYHNRGRSR
jgi:hypothetical protein